MDVNRILGYSVRIWMSVSVKGRLWTADWEPGVKCRLSAKCRLGAKCRMSTTDSG